MTARKPFLIVAGVWVVLVAATHIAIPLLFRDRLPDPIAVHWGPSGEPDGSGPLLSITLLGLVMWLVMAGGGLLAMRSPKQKARYAWPVASVVFGTVLTLGITISTVWANLDAGSWQQARSLSWQVLLIVVVATGGALAAVFLSNRLVDEPADDTPAPTMTLPAGQRAVWVSSTSSQGMLWLGTGSLVATLVLCALAVVDPMPSLWISASVFGISGLVVLVLSSVRVRIGESGVAIALGPVRWPVRRVALDRIETARSEERSPSSVGGWGYRGLPGAATIMIRAGECLVLRYRKGGELGISIDDAERGAALINALLAEDRV